MNIFNFPIPKGFYIYIYIYIYITGLLHAGDLVLYGELKEDLRAMVGHFVEVCRSSSLKVNGGRSKGWY